MDWIMRSWIASLPACLVAAGAAWAMHRLDAPAFAVTLLVGIHVGWSAYRMMEEAHERARQAMDEVLLAADEEAMVGKPASPATDDTSPRMILPMRPWLGRPRRTS